MNQINVEIQQPAINKLGAQSIIDFYRTLAINELCFTGLSAFVTGDTSSALNVVIDTQDNNHWDEKKAHEITNFFQSYQVPWCILVTSISKTKNLEDLNFKLTYRDPSMYFDLSQDLPSTINIDIKEETDDLLNWVEPEREGFPSSDNCETYRKLNAELLKKGEKKLRHFTAYENNEPISSGTLFLSDNAVMIHNLATKNKFRRQGVASALTQYMMQEAKKLNYRHCFLDSSADGVNLYRKLGFKIYCITSVYEMS